MSRKYIIWFLVIIYAVGITGHLLEFSRELMITLTPYTLLITGGVVIYATGLGKQVTTWLIAVYSLTTMVEILGVKTGIVFGNYYYGDVLGPKIFEVPLIIGFNWVLVILGAVVISGYTRGSIIVKALLTGMLAVLFDILLEPAAVFLEYWQWAGGSIPVLNYITWFVLSFISALLYSFLKVQTEKVVPMAYFIIQVLFFAILNIIV